MTRQTCSLDIWKLQESVAKPAKTATNCKDKINEKSADTRLRQSEQENYQQWII